MRKHKQMQTTVGRLAVALVLGWAALACVAAERGPTRAAAAAVQADSGRVIVQYKADSAMVRVQAARGTVLAQHAGTLGARLGLSLRDGRALGARQQVIHAQGLDSATLASRLAADAQVEWAVPDRRRRATMVPNDPYFGAGQADPMPPAGQWWLQPYGNALVSATRMTAAWDTTLGSGQVVAVLDTGVRAEHPDLAGRFLAGYNMISPDSGGCLTGNGSCRNADASDPGDWVTQADIDAHPDLWDSTCLGDSSWHGTQVSGILGASTNNGLGVAGVASAASILPLRVLGKCGGYDSDIIDAIRWAAGLHVAGVPDNAHPARVINLSLGGSGACGNAYQTAIDEVIAQKQAVVVVAAGNEGDAVGAPANCNGVIAVGGLRHVGTKVGYSNLGPEVTLSAPAGNCVNDTGACLYPIVTTLNSGTTTPGSSIYSDAYAASLGTSFSAPIVAGTATLVLAAQPALTSAQVTQVLRSTARAFPSSGGDAGSPICHAPGGALQDTECYCTTTTCGAGMLDAAAAVAAATGIQVTAQATPNRPVAGSRVVLSSAGSQVGAGRSIAGYQWQIVTGSGIASWVSATNAASATLDTSGNGTVSVRLTITDDLGIQASTQIDIAVQASALQAAIAATPAAPTAGDSVSLSAAGSSVDSGRSIVAWQWAVVSGSAQLSGATNAATATLMTSAAGPVTVRLTVTDDQGLQSSVDSTLTVAAAASGGGGGALTLWWALGLALAGLGLGPRRRR